MASNNSRTHRKNRSALQRQSRAFNDADYHKYINLNNETVDQLKARCLPLAIRVTSKMRKADIITKIKERVA